jgi:hypothetical protein
LPDTEKDIEKVEECSSVQPLHNNSQPLFK